MLTLRTAVAVAALAVAGLAACGDDSTPTSAVDSAAASESASESTSASPSDTPAEPAAGSLADPAGDVKLDGKSPDPRPDAVANTDLTGLSATYDGQQLVVTMTYVEALDASAVDDYYSGFVIDSSEGKVEVVRLADGDKPDLSGSEDSMGACGSTAQDSGNVTTMTVPASCFGTPETVSVGDAYATSSMEFDGEWVIDYAGTEDAAGGPMVEAVPL
jgi:hypothetical protein